MSAGHIRKRIAKDGTVSYQVIYESEKDPITGKRQRQYKTVNGTKKEAEAILDRMKNEFNATGILKPSALKLSDWMHEWLDLYLPNIEATTRAGYTERINKRLIPYIGNTPLKNLQTATIQQWVSTLHRVEQLSPKSVKNVFLNLKAALDKAVTLKMLPSNPCTGVVLPKPVDYHAEVYDGSEIELLLDKAKGTDIYLLVVLIVSIGFRRGEISALQWSDIDFEHSVIHITKSKVIADGKKIVKAPKTKSGTRDIYIGKNLLKLLKSEYAKYCRDKLSMGKDFVDSNCVIRQENGACYSPDSLTQKWIRFHKANELKPIRLHDLRHTCATAMLGEGVDFKVMQTRLGHSDIRTTMNTYAHTLPSMNKEAGEKLDTMMFGDKKNIG